MVENRNLLHIPVEVPEHPSSLPSTRAGNNTRDKASSESRSSNSGRGRPEPNRHGMHPGSTGLPEMIAKGLMDRGESLGINKTLMSAVSELKVNAVASSV
jgi:TBC1 domain family protein 5